MNILSDEEIKEAIGDPCATPQMMDDARSIIDAVIAKLNAKTRDIIAYHAVQSDFKRLFDSLFEEEK